jgi:hypothetical protein
MFTCLLIVALTALSELSTPNTEEKKLQEFITVLTTEDENTPKTETAAAPSTENTPATPTTDTIAPADQIAIQKTAQPIIITNAIESSMLAYKHWTGTYNPDSFTVTINGAEIAQGNQHTLPAETKTVDIAFSYSFMSGMRTGTKTISYQLHENITQATITFSWKDDNKILLDNGTLLKVTA